MALRDVLRAVLPQRARHAARGVLGDVRWIREELIVSPSWALFCQRRGARNTRFVAHVKAEEAMGRDLRLEPYRASKIPKIIWMYWDKGEEQAPELVRLCIESWRKHNPGWEVRVLDSAAARRYADFSMLDGKAVPKRFYANVLRLELLARHGGVWADGTVLCHRPLDDWLPMIGAQGFMAFVNGGPDRLAESWFIASEAAGALAGGWRDVYVGEIAKIAIKPRAYFFLSYAFEWAIRRDPSLAEAWARCPRLPAPPCFMATAALLGRLDRAIVVDLIRQGLPMSKLTWKVPVPVAEVERLVADAAQSA